MSASGPAVTSAGLVAGMESRGVVSFKGVPYGASTESDRLPTSIRA